MKKFAPYIPIVGIFLVFYYIIVKLDYEFNKKFYELLDAKFKNRDDGSSLFDFLEFREAGSNANMGKVVLDKNYDMAAEVFDPAMLSLRIQPSLTVYRNSVIADTTASRDPHVYVWDERRIFKELQNLISPQMNCFSKRFYFWNI